MSVANIGALGVSVERGSAGGSKNRIAMRTLEENCQRKHG